jgi:hypothetical protein
MHAKKQIIISNLIIHSHLFITSIYTHRDSLSHIHIYATHIHISSTNTTTTPNTMSSKSIQKHQHDYSCFNYWKKWILPYMVFVIVYGIRLMFFYTVCMHTILHTVFYLIHVTCNICTTCISLGFALSVYVYICISSIS